VKRIALALEASRERIASTLPRHLTPERMIRVAMAAIYRTPKLQECDPWSIAAAVMQASELGLEPGGVRQEGYLVPYFNKKTKSYECQFQPSYRGLLKLSRQSGEIRLIAAHVVYEGDTFEIKYGFEPDVVHRPALSERGQPVAVYSVAVLQSGERDVEFMTAQEVEAIRRRSKSPDEGPWVTDWGEMARKTVLRRHLKRLPCSVQLAMAIERDNAHYELESEPDLQEKTTAKVQELRARLSAPNDDDAAASDGGGE